MPDTNLLKLLDVLQAQKDGADNRIKYYDSMLKEQPHDSDYKRFQSVALAEYHAIESVIRMIQDKNVLDRVYTIWFEE